MGFFNLEITVRSGILAFLGPLPDRLAIPRLAQAKATPSFSERKTSAHMCIISKSIPALRR